MTMSVALAENRFRTYARFVKLEHTVFSLPLIFAGTILAARQLPSVQLTALLLLAAAGARTMAMGFNRLIDAEIDARNPRTQRRELPRGAMQRREAWAIVALAGAIYVLSAAAIAPICLWLSPIPVILFFIYPYLKRVTTLAHLGLGLAWSMGPLAGWLAAASYQAEAAIPSVSEGRLAPLSAIKEVSWLWLFSVLWVTGFDIIYATLDEAFDRQAGLHSLPAQMGKRPALRVAAVLHGAAFAALATMWLKQLYSDAALWWLAAIGALFIWQHAVAEKKPEFAFFKLSGVLGFLVFGFVATGL